MNLLYILNRFVARLRGSVGWCAAAYLFNRTGFILKEDGYEDIVHRAMNPLTAWWGAFMFEWRDV